MLANFHMHTTFSDGKNTPEEIVEMAIKQGFCSIGFSDHAYTPYDLRYCMKDEQGYRREIQRLKEKYKKDIQIYLGVEEDSRVIVNRANYDYIIGSCHYISFGDKINIMDSNYEYFSTCLKKIGGDAMALAENYFQHFCAYILKRKPDIIGHFDLITKFEEQQRNDYLSNNAYWAMAERYLLQALKSESIFEINTGLVTRGFRTTFCPHERLLYLIYKNKGKVTISSDAHELKNLQSYFIEVNALLKEIGFRDIYILQNGEWVKKPIS